MKSPLRGYPLIFRLNNAPLFFVQERRNAHHALTGIRKEILIRLAVFVFRKSVATIFFTAAAADKVVFAIPAVTVNQP